MCLICVTCIAYVLALYSQVWLFSPCLPIFHCTFPIMLSIASQGHQRDMLPRISVYGNDLIRYGSDIRANIIFSSNSIVLINSPVQCSSPSFHHPCCTFITVCGCDQLCVLPICPVSFSAAKTHRPPLVQVVHQPHLNHPSFVAAYACNPIASTSYLSE